MKDWISIEMKGFCHIIFYFFFFPFRQLEEKEDEKEEKVGAVLLFQRPHCRVNFLREVEEKFPSPVGEF